MQVLGVAALEIDLVHEDGGANVSLVGDLDIAGLPTLDAAFRALVSRYDGEQVRIDCRRLTFLDAAGLGGLIRQANRLGGCPTLFDVTGIPLLVLRTAPSCFEVESANA